MHVNLILKRKREKNWKEVEGNEEARGVVEGGDYEGRRKKEVSERAKGRRSGG